MQPVLGLVILPPIILGLVQGAGFGLVAIGLVLIYKSSKVFNFAAGEFATVGAFASYNVTRGFTLSLFGVHLPHIPRLPLIMAVPAGMLAGAAFGLLVERLVVRPLSNRPKVTVLVGTAAVAISAIAGELLLNTQGKAFAARPLARGSVMTLAGVNILWQELFILLALALAGAGLAFFFGATDLGLATLASSQEPTASRLMGIRLNRVSMLTWGVAGGLGGLAGVLLPPLTQNFFAAYGTTDLLIAAFTAAVLGGMTSVPGAFVGGLLVGLVQNLTLSNVSGNTLPGAPAVAVLVVLIGVLVIRPTGLLGREA